MEVPKPQTFVPPVQAAPPVTGVPAPAGQEPQKGTARVAPPGAPLRKAAPRTSVLVVAGLVLSLAIFGVGYVAFIKPDTAPAATLFAQLFPARSGVIQLQTIELDFDAVVLSPVFQKLQRQGAPIEIPPLGKPNPFL